jgi:hypothetical protein
MNWKNKKNNITEGRNKNIISEQSKRLIALQRLSIGKMTELKITI